MAEVLEPVGSFVDGEAVRPTSSDLIEVISPWTEKAMGSLAQADTDLVDQAVRSSVAAARGWRETAPADRAALLDRVADLIERDSTTIAGIVSAQMGMPITLARATQGDLPARVLRATAELVRNAQWEEPIDGAVLVRKGAGCVGAISPWNMPVHQIIAKVSAAVGAGASIVLKPSEQTPYDAVHLARLFVEAGAPAGLFNVVNGTGPVTGAALTGHHDLARLSFTGSVAAGRLVAAAGAATLTPCTLELGGKSPAVLLPDVDVEAVLPKVLQSGFINSGQACNATTRLVVPTALVAQVEELIPSLVAAMKVGDPSDPATQIGPLVTERQREKVLDYVRIALEDGGQLLTGSDKPSVDQPHGWFVDPVVVTGVSRSSRVVQEEIFGPVVVIQPYTDIDDAVEVANNTVYGLSAEVWSADADDAKKVARRIDAGQVKVNGVRTRERPLVPFGGIGDSGYGRELGEHGVFEMCEITAVVS